MERKNIDKNVSLLFWRLIKQTPALINNRKLIYNLNGDLIKIWWYSKKEGDSDETSCSEYYIEPFIRDVKSDPLGYWSVVLKQGKELDGYTFFIETPICKFKVPELSRRELCEAQDLIEKHFENFIPRYLDSLLNIPEDYYGKVSIEDRYSNLVAY